MCGRFISISQENELIKNFSITETKNDHINSYNFCPQDLSSIVIEEKERRQLELARWGFAINPSHFTINARLESLVNKSCFQKAFKWQRCLLPANGFYEWEEKGSAKQPYFVSLERTKLFAFAGLYNICPKSLSKSFCIVTCPAKKSLRKLHSRMPLILSSKAMQDLWLKLEQTPSLELLLKEALKLPLNYYAVSSKVNKRSSDSPDCIQKVSPELQYDLFN
ncbi:MAG: hypothetical protein GWP59_00100 [Chlamydiales bacterium]|nr:SOS response-associated peptidase [Chlamydiales bacterium]NCF70082.1 hypothetical protein [Chlamydiales bacterium]